MRIRIMNWLDSRTGSNRLINSYKNRVLPDGASWILSSAGCLFWLFVIEVITGLLLMTCYSPSVPSAWASVHYIDGLPGGEFIRGLHYYNSQALIILFTIHTLRVLLMASFRKPKEIIWITGILIAPAMVVWAVTGNPLPGTLDGFSQINVEGNIIASTPIVGPIFRKLLLGGDEVGNRTITHLYFLHVALFPIIMGLLLGLHITQIYRHSDKIDDLDKSNTKAVPYWPYQSIRNLTTFSLIFGLICGMVWFYGHPLKVPADSGIHHVPRPEWYFIFLFELRRYFTGQWEVVATLIIPGIALTLLLLMPLIDRISSEKTSKVMRYLIVTGGILTWSGLTMLSVLRDHSDVDYQHSKTHLAALTARVNELADHDGVPPQGAITLLRNDPKIQGPILFIKHCSSCHSHADANGKGIIAESPSAPNLYQFGSREWIQGLLDPEKIQSEHYFGKTEFKEGEMAEWILSSGDSEEEEDIKDFKAEMKQVVISLSAQAQLKSQAEMDKKDTDLIREGDTVIKEGIGCTDCHQYHDAGELGSGPDLTDYASRSWMVDFISNPAHERFYSDSNDRMPKFHDNFKEPNKNLLDQKTIEIITDWIRGDWYELERD